MELREVLRGQRTKSPYVRVMTTQTKGGFRRRASGVLEAMPEASQPRGGFGALYGRFKSLLVGVPLSSARLAHERLSKKKALAVFSSDALSSSAYATEEILVILAFAGSAYLGLSIPIALAITLLMAIVVSSYRQTIRAYPGGGGAYIVARENLGVMPGLAAAGALLVDYTLTVSVSVAAGTAAIIAALPEVGFLRIEIAVAAIVIITVLNLRGISESATIFAFPTYAFVFLGLALIAVGVIRVATGNAEPVVYEEALVATQGLTLFLVLRAFSSGSAALSGIEAISNGVPSFKPPEAKNAAQTLVAMGVILATLFVGITLLSRYYGLHPVEGKTIVSQLGEVVFGKNALFYVWQAATALILLLAANTSFSAFPSLASLLAKDSYMPRQFTFRGDRLAFSNGIIVLGLASAVIMVIFGASVTRLIPLYAVGVFASFTLSQLGMVIFWRRNRTSGWRRGVLISGFGAVATCIVTSIIVVTKFLVGAWMSILMGVLLVFFFRAIKKHYETVDSNLELPSLDMPLPVVSRAQTVLVPVRSLNRASVRAIAYARSISDDVTALHVTDDLQEAERMREQWERWAGEVPLVIIESPYRSFIQPVLSYIDTIDDKDPESLITVVLPEFVPNHWWQTPLHNQEALRLKAALLFRRNTVVIDVPQHLGAGAPR
jgi:amino acid transporter